MIWQTDFDSREQSIVEFMRGELFLSNTPLTAEMAAELLQEFEDCEEYQAAYRCRPLTAADFNDNQV